MGAEDEALFNAGSSRERAGVRLKVGKYCVITLNPRSTLPDDVARWPEISLELLERNGLSDAAVYWQVTRGSAPRHHAIPEETAPTVLAMAYPEPALDPEAPPGTVTVVLEPDRRWLRCDIKSLMLLPNVLARNAAQQAGADEAVMHRDGVVTEGASTSVFIASHGRLRTHLADHAILGGITRAILLDLARAANIPVEETTFTIDELRSADEVLICGTTTNVASVTHVDGRPVGGAQVGPMARRLHKLLMAYIQRECLS